MCVCEEDAIIVLLLLVERTREISPISSFLLDCLWSFDARAHVYHQQESMYVSKMCVCVHVKKQRRNILYRDRMSMFDGQMDGA